MGERTATIDTQPRLVHCADMDEERTIIVKPSAAGWVVYRVQTKSSRYTLGVFGGSAGRRRCAVLRGSSHGEQVNAEDSAPLVGEKSLFDLSPPEWVGHSLQIGTTKTSPIQSVELEDDPIVVTSVTSLAPVVTSSREFEAGSSKRAATTRQWSAYPADMVEYAESAAKLLQAVYAKQDLADDLRAHPKLAQRFKFAVGECFLVLKALGERFSEPENR